MRLPFFKIAVCLAVSLYALFIALGNLPFEEGKRPSWLSDKQISLGLDLRGGSYLLLEVETDVYIKEQAEGLRDSVREALNATANDPEGRIYYVGGVSRRPDGVTVRLKNPEQSERAVNIISRLSSDADVSFVDGVVTARFSEQALDDMRGRVMEQTLEIVRRRVDETGTREPDIQRQGSNRVLLQVPGLDDPAQLKSLLGQTAKLTFHEVRNEHTGALPPGFIRLPFADAREGTIDLVKKIMIGGENLSDAQPGYSQNNEPVVNIRFDNIGAKKFADATRRMVGKPFAIVLDGKVLTAPVIRAVILGGSAEISGSFTAKEASELSILLRAGALPAPLNTLEERTVGPGLGKDSVEAGSRAMIYAFIAVIICMIVIYRTLGIFCSISLIINLALIIAVMSIMGATLTLPGIAGIVLNTGMAVDANVLIYERIKEEIANGAKNFRALEDGFARALETIMDANITTLIATVLLYFFGSGPVKGFAITLSVGIMTSLFSAIFLTRIQTETWMVLRRPRFLFRAQKKKWDASKTQKKATT